MISPMWKVCCRRYPLRRKESCDKINFAAAKWQISEVFEKKASTAWI